jgi:N-acetylneuraminic acid mutarotase
LRKLANWLIHLRVLQKGYDRKINQIEITMKTTPEPGAEIPRDNKKAKTLRQILFAGLLGCVVFAGYPLAAQNEGMVGSVVKAPVVPDGNVAGREVEMVVNFDTSLDPSVSGRTLLAGNTIKITFPDDFVSDGRPLGQIGTVSLDEFNSGVLLQGWPQNPVSPSKYTLGYEGTHTIVFTANEDLAPVSDRAPGIKQVHLAIPGFRNPLVPGHYSILVEAETGRRGALEMGLGDVNVIAEPQPNINVASIFDNPDRPRRNKIYQELHPGETTSLSMDFLLWDGAEEPFLGVEISGSLLVQDGNEVGRISIDGPSGAQGQEVFTTEPSSLVNAPVTGTPTALLQTWFRAGSATGDYTITFALNDGNSVETHVRSKTWVTKTDMSTRRLGLAAAVVDGKIYAIGGSNGERLATVDEYDPAKDTWIPKADMPTARKDIAAAAVNGKIYVFGGSEESEGGGITTTEEYDVATDTWTPRNDMPTARLGAAAVALDGKIYVAGGWGISKFESIMEVYDPATDTWEVKSEAPIADGNFSYAGVNGKIYIFGGTQNRTSTLEYDPMTDIWTRKEAKPSDGLYSTASVLGGKVYVLGGTVGHGTPPSDRVEVYDPVNDTWSIEVSMSIARGNLASASLNGRIYTFGGHNGLSWGNLGTIYATVEEFSVPQEPGPELNIQKAFLISWPRTDTDHILESATTLEGPWTEVEQFTAQVIGDEIHLTVVRSNLAQFFRLKSPL